MVMMMPFICSCRNNILIRSSSNDIVNIVNHIIMIAKIVITNSKNIVYDDTQVLLRDLLGDVSFEREAAVLR